MNITQKSKEGLVKQIESNGNFEKFYANRYEKEVQAIKLSLVKHEKDITALIKKSKDLELKHTKEENDMKAKQRIESNAISEEQGVLQGKIDKAGGYWGGINRYGEDKINVSDAKAKNAYDMWRKELISKIWLADTSEEAGKAVNEFFAG